MSEFRLVYTAADVNYRLQAQVLVASLSRSQTDNLQVLVFGSGWSADDVARLRSVADSHISVEVRDVDQSLHTSIRLTNGFPLATAYNVLAPKAELPRNVRAVYMDADVVVRDDLTPLFTMPMDHAVAAVVDAHVSVVGVPSMWRPWREERVDPLTPYLNTGVLVVDVARWCDESLTERIVEKLEQYDLPCVDQDAINLILRGRFDRLAPRFNSMPYHLMKLLRNADLVESDADLGDAIANPAVVHFHRSFLGKPWVRASTHPARQLWTQLADIVDPRWRKSIDVVGVARGLAASRAKMSVLDERAHSMRKLTWR